MRRRIPAPPPLSLANPLIPPSLRNAINVCCRQDLQPVQDDDDDAADDGAGADDPPHAHDQAVPTAWDGLPDDDELGDLLGAPLEPVRPSAGSDGRDGAWAGVGEGEDLAALLADAPKAGDGDDDDLAALLDLEEPGA